MIRAGLQIPNFTYPGVAPDQLFERIADVAVAAEDSGFDTIMVMDHFYQLPLLGPPEHEMFEAYTLLGAIAARTSTAKLGTLVTGVTYRNPAILAKVVTALDVISKGRAFLGIGAAWFELEHDALGVGFPAVKERFERLEEALQICLQMWDPDDNGPYQGQHYELAETLCSPQPLSRPHPPILIGGTGERKTLRLVAQYADACNLFASTPAEISHKLDVLRRHCDDVGRDAAEIHKTILYQGTALAGGDVDTFVGEMADYAKLGVETVIVMPQPGPQAGWIADTGATAAARLAELPTP